jgi:putative endonuclease
MQTSVQTGKNGEALAARFLEAAGLTILHRNWKFSYYEIDLVAAESDVLHIVEVKTRRSLRFGYPEESITARKFASLQKAAEAYQQQYSGWKWLQFDVISILLLKGKEPDIFWVKDVYF